ncbi:MAG TPA: precorrin-6y C5,15-methyltransferase (decarboxylating) subunit CbiE [Syntrophomonadaceae bacterium]|nr:precorrin-6y C5,15-methyltransferase (decarboxylating) subunit CbiE [Syntrophomonadaceae bacterium]
MEPVVKIVGTGPGDPRYLTPLAQEAIKSAQVLVGGLRQLQTLASPHQEQYVVGKDLPSVVDFINEQRHNKTVVVLASGDPGLFSIASYLAQHLDPDNLEFIPGISSVQVMFARLKRPWQEVPVYSLHGRSLEDLESLFQHATISVLLTGGIWTPQAIAQHLLGRHRSETRVAIGQNLSYPDEKLIFSTLGKLVEDPGDYKNCVMVMFYEQ